MEFLAYSRSGCAEKPLIVFIPGSSHLARVAYGHPGSIKSDFLDHWLAQANYSFCAISYPLDHPIFSHVYPSMTVNDWACGTVDIVRRIAGGLEHSGEVVILLWSMAGRTIHRLVHHARRQSIRIKCFISLAATAPLTGMAPLELTFLRTTTSGLRDTSSPLPDGSSYDHGLWGRGIHYAEESLGRKVVGDNDYQKYYRGDHPIQLRGEKERFFDGNVYQSAIEAIDDAGLFDFENYKLTAALIPNSLEDARHALTDKSIWSFYNTQYLYNRLQALEILASRIETCPSEVNDLFESGIDSLSRRIEGNHFFFIGPQGARSTVCMIEDLIEQVHRIETILAALAPNSNLHLKGTQHSRFVGP
ncbi:hypothetical protein [Sinorhizobium meliloti]|uniref:Alpha/beta hydrolase n=1 Tax=Rhizobium meliloti TaxID=382 RepID=A0AAW9TJA7_RHIML|nr:hypothetical protein [Sinorhizobium meliloti]MQW32109.1 hypothetical protein [Sinorhizobium meliloti]